MSNYLNSILFISFFVFLFISCDEENKPSIQINNPAALDAVIDQFVDEGFYPCLYARIESIDGELIYEHGISNKELLPNKKVDGDTWFRIWSMSKIVTITTVLDMVEDGILKLEDPVFKYIPEFKDLKVAVTQEGKSLTEYEWGNRDNVCPIKIVDNDSVMTVLHLINHEAGFYYATSGFPCLDSMVAEQNITKAKDAQDLINRLAKLPLVQHSGTDYFYGTNTTVLGLVAERATGKSLKQLVEERVTKPLKINGLQYGLSQGVELMPRFTGRDSILREAVDGELHIMGADVPDYEPERELYLGGEGMLGTADGYADFVRMLLRRGELNGYRFLEKETVKEIYSPQTQLDNPYGHNGYNLWVSGDSMRIKGQGEAGLWIGGGYECTYFWADPKRNFVGLIMSQNNEVRAPGYEMVDKVRGEIYEQIWESEKSN